MRFKCFLYMLSFAMTAMIMAGCGSGSSSASPTTTPPPVPSQLTWKISGNVTDYQTSVALAGVTIALSTSNSSISTVTDANGDYSFSGLGNGSYLLTPTKAGYIFPSPSQTVTVNSADKPGIKFAGTAHSGQVLGLVADSGGLPFAPVQIDIYKDGNLLSTQKNDIDGSFAISLPPSGATGYTFKFSKADYRTLSYENIAVTENQNTYLEMLFLIHNSFAGLGDISGRINNALTGTGVNDLTVRLRNGINVTSGPVIAATTTFNDGSPTDPKSDGAYTFVDPVSGAATIYGGNYTAEVFGSGFTPVFFSGRCLGGLNTPNQNMTVAPKSATDLVRIVLTWYTKQDLDSHLTGPTGSGGRFHTWYADKIYSDSVTSASLDVDNTVAYGPETTTISLRTAGVYRFSVHDYTNLAATTSSALSRSGAQVRVYKGNALLQTFNVPPGRGGTLWTIFEMDGTTAAITPINRMSYQSVPSNIQ